MYQSSHSSDVFYIRPNYETTTMNLDNIKLTDPNHQLMKNIRKSVCSSGFLIFVWVGSLFGYAYLDQFHKDIRPQYLILVLSIIGGMGISKFSGVSFALLSLSKSRKEK